MPKPENVIGKTFRDMPERINREGRPKGSRNRSTVAKFILELNYLAPDEIKEKVEREFPDMPKKVSVEEIMTLMQVRKAITENDTAAYRAVQDSAYGAPKQEIDMGEDRLTRIEIFEITKK